MLSGRSSALTGIAGSDSDTEASLPVLRWLLLGAVALTLAILALSRAGAVGAAAPADCIPLNYTTCVSNGVFYTNGNPTSSVTQTYVAPSYSYVAPSYSYGAPGYSSVAPSYVASNTSSTGYPPNTVISTYPDPRYCGGLVSVVTDGSGNLINVCPGTGQRIYPVFGDYGYGYGGYASPYVNSYYNNNYNGYYNNYYNGGCPSGNFSCLGYTNGNFFGSYPYSTGVFNGSYTVVAPGGNPLNVGAPYRVAEVTQPTTNAQAAPAAAPAAPTAQMATGLNAPLQQPTPDVSAGGADVKVLSVPQTTTPAASSDGHDDMK